MLKRTCNFDVIRKCGAVEDGNNIGDIDKLGLLKESFCWNKKYLISQYWKWSGLILH